MEEPRSQRREEEEAKMSFPEGLLTALRSADRIAVLTGAGISAESGVPTFRDAQTGLWANFRPEELATPEAFRRNPKRVWEWYMERRRTMETVMPNDGHRTLAAWEERVPALSIATQNIDGLHRKAGSRCVYELHGNIHRTKCFDEGRIVESWNEDGHVPPVCPVCGGFLRPDVVWFGEFLPEGEMEAATKDALTCDVYFSIGTSSIVYPAAGLPMMARQAGSVLVEINPEETTLTSNVDYFLSGKSGEILPRLLDRVFHE